MAEASPAAREVFQEVDEALGQHLFKLMSEGPESDLTLTANAQPAIMANAIAVLRVLGRDMEAVRQLLIAHWLALRPLVHGVPAEPLRLWAT